MNGIDQTLKEFTREVFRDDRGRTLPYRLLQPPRRAPGTAYPLVLFLHGAGEKGDDNERQLTNGVEQFALPDNRKKYPCFVAAPQCPRHQWWGSGDGGLAEPMELAFGLLAALEREYPVDPRRRYITGISMGGFGTWDALAARPDYFAAAIPVCGGGEPAHAGRYVNLPLWVFHGARDQVVDVQYSRIMVDALQRAGGAPKYTEYPQGRHDVWNTVYRDPAVLAWLFAQLRPAP
jgi:predicted peptidase